MSEPTIAELKEQIKQYELQLEKEKLVNATQREKISTMSSEVVDSNPYRHFYFCFTRLHFEIRMC